MSMGRQAAAGVGVPPPAAALYVGQWRGSVAWPRTRTEDKPRIDADRVARSKGREVVQKPKKFRSESSIINDCIPLLVTPRSKQIHQIIIVFLSGPRNCPKRSARMQSNYL